LLALIMKLSPPASACRGDNFMIDRGWAGDLLQAVGLAA